MPTTDVDPVWGPDPLLEGFEYLSLALPDAQHYAGESEDLDLHGGLIRPADQGEPGPAGGHAVLYLHGWSDYFFQAELADRVRQWRRDGRPVGFYAVELRRYGRSLLDEQDVSTMLGGYTTDLSEYYTELDQALACLQAAGHTSVTLMAHSTGGLVGALWLADRAELVEAGVLQGLVLNSGWLEFQTSPLVRTAVGAVARGVGLSANRAVATLPLRTDDEDPYIRSTHASLEGSWDFDLAIKRHKSFTIRPGWLGAITVAQTRVRAGLDLRTPVLSLSSARSVFKRQWDGSQASADVVLDVDRLQAAAARLGPHVTLVRIEGGVHDLALSREPVREEFYATMQTWFEAWLGGTGGASGR